MQSQFPTPSSHLLLAGGRGLRQAGRLLLPGGPTGLHRRGGRHGASARLLLHWCCLLVSLPAACLCGSLQQPQQPIGQGGSDGWWRRMRRKGLLCSTLLPPAPPGWVGPACLCSLRHHSGCH